MKAVRFPIAAAAAVIAMPPLEEAGETRASAFLHMEMNDRLIDPDGDNAVALRVSLCALSSRRRTAAATPYARPALAPSPS
jgi:hypothetical protein